MASREERIVEVSFDKSVFYAFQMMLTEEEYMLTYEKAQELYNKICILLMLVPTRINVR